MTDAALIALATSSAGVTVVTIGAVFMTSWWLRDAKDAAARYSAQAATLTEQLKASAALVADLTGKLKTANARVEALDVENQKLRTSQPVAGSFDRLRAEAAAENSHGTGPGVVPDHKAAAEAGIDDLLDPAKS